MGAGGIGGTVTACLTQIAADVTAVTTNQAIYQAVREHGFRTSGEGGRRAVRGRIELGVPVGERFDVVLLATQPPQVDEAARAALPALGQGGVMVCFQNGLCESRIAAIAGPERVIGGIVAWGASMPEPGLYDRTAAGGFTLGRLAGPPDDALGRVAALLEAVGPVALTENLLGARWSKLALNCAVSSLGTIGGDRLGPLVRVRRYRRLGLEEARELTAWNRARGRGVLEHLDDIYRRVGLFVTEQVSLTKPGADGLAEIRAAMARFRKQTPKELAGQPVEQVVDLLPGEGGLPPSDVLVFKLAGGRRVIMRPSGTEPKLKSYYEVRVVMTAGEPMTAARQRGLVDLAKLRDAHQKLLG